MDCASDGGCPDALRQLRDAVAVKIQAIRVRMARKHARQAAARGEQTDQPKHRRKVHAGCLVPVAHAPLHAHRPPAAPGARVQPDGQLPPGSGRAAACYLVRPSWSGVAVTYGDVDDGA
ncbi:hypothetical protein ACQ4PT_026521 [Festuca glaucescens]